MHRGLKIHIGDRNRIFLEPSVFDSGAVWFLALKVFFLAGASMNDILEDNLIMISCGKQTTNFKTREGFVKSLNGLNMIINSSHKIYRE